MFESIKNLDYNFNDIFSRLHDSLVFTIDVFRSNMPKLKIGDPAPDISLPAIDGTTFEMSSMKGRRVIFTFFRFSTCPFCNIRINRIMKRWDEFPENTVMVGVFDAEVSDLAKRMAKHNPKFTISVRLKDTKVFEGFGRSKKIAEQNAAKKLLDNIT